MASRVLFIQKEFYQEKNNIMSKVLPITPAEVVVKKQESIPDGIFEAFNELIAENFNGSESKFKLKDVVNLAVSKMPDVPKDTMFEKHYFDVEEIYRKAGWMVEFDKAGYNETYDDFFVFIKK